MAIPSRLGRRPGGQRFPLWHVPIVRKLWFGSACYPPNPAGWAKSVQDYASTLAGGVGCSSDAICRRVDQGYPYLFDFWKQGYRIDIDFDTPVRAVAANPLVVQDAGMVAMTGGSIVYWAEEMDNRANLRLLHLDGSALSDDASRAKVEPFAFGVGAVPDDPRAEGHVDAVSCSMFRL